MNWPGETIVVRLWETLAEKAIGSLLKPWQMRREGRTLIELRREEMLMLAQVERDAQAIQEGRATLGVEGRLLMAPDSAQGAAVAEQSIGPAVDVVARIAIGDALRREINVSKAVLAAEADLEDGGGEPPDERVDADWLFRWRECAGAVSSEELQGLWGRVLSGEVRQPGRYSYRTLEFIRNLTFQEARAIEEACAFVIDNVLVKLKNDGLDAFGLTFAKLLSLQELGVISGVGGVGLRVSWKSREVERFMRPLLCSGKMLMVTDENGKRELTVGCYKLTNVGGDVFSLGRFSPNEKYLRLVGEQIVADGFHVLVADYEILEDGQISYFNGVEVNSVASPG
jgi:hypothetical protein